MASYKDYMLFDKLPHTWCAGCGDGIVLQSIAAVFADMGVALLCVLNSLRTMKIK